ncbi:chorismate mutase family protein [Actinoplanes siamensis]|uniref:Chorismate mutase n=1 Tax=Actinoplanes siamensis TaxID=1223317 RepID=A0A919NDX3_9ACTN|nr:chorismate mutase [Actinoplanes siamensis]GIF09356.1 hypothetical protein Asi03nite_68940 [Actinoplanes siamensis]
MDNLTDRIQHDSIDRLRRSVEELDDEIAQLWRRRTAISRTLDDLRVAGGGTRISLATEYATVARYRDALGDDGGSLALLLLRAARRGKDQTS